MSAPGSSEAASSWVRDLERRLQRLEDLEAIRALFVRYCDYVDRGDFESYSRLFTANGETVLGPYGRAKGPEAIRALLTQVKAGLPPGGRHLTTNPVIDLHGDRATSRAMWTLVRPGADGTPQLAGFGFHLDVLVRQNGAWKLLRREVVGSLPVDRRVELRRAAESGEPGGRCTP